MAIALTSDPLAVTHPCFSSDGGWVKDSKGKKLDWKIDNYFYERGFEIPLTQELRKLDPKLPNALQLAQKALLRERCKSG